ncbi:MAG: hypothetical protein EPO35_01260 [Acidobacteria bacterium]|nr:MAG: hypothetical protein EPO35_01260 [Acidobacteriota bacterium]
MKGHRGIAGLLILAAFAVLPAAQTETVIPRPRGYVAVKAAAAPVIDGKLDDAAWSAAAWTEAFVDIEGDVKPKPALLTRAKMTWDDTYFYVGAALDEPALWSDITAHDAVIFHENDFEVFIDPDGDSHAYYEFEINARGTFWDLFLPVPYRAGGKALDSWEIPGLKSAVAIDGTLNHPGDVDRGWTVELAFPWAVLGQQANRPAPPRDGDQWRVNFSRVEWTTETAGSSYRAKAGVPEHNWVWSPQHVVDMHRPERWGYVQFSDKPAALVPDPSWPARQWLQAIYEAQREFRRTRGRYAATLGELELNVFMDFSLGRPQLWATPSLFEASIETRVAGGPPVVWRIRQDARVWSGQ